MYDTEKKLYQALKTNLRKVHWQRIETGALQQGVPDVNGCYGGREFWVELKCTTTDSVSLTPFQCSWHMLRASAGGRSWIMVAHSKHNVMTLHRGVDAGRLLEQGVSSSIAFKINAPVDWPMVLSQLCLTDSLKELID